jgi:hypothetical protein
MSSTFELYERLQKVIPTERLNNIDFLKKSFDNILEIISNNHIINKVSSDIDIFYKTKIKNFSLYESKCLILNNIKDKTKKQYLFDKNENSNLSFEVVNYLNDKNNLCIFDVNKNKLIKNLPELDDIRIIHGFKYGENMTITIDNYLNICINYKKDDYRLSIYLYKNIFKYPLILFYNSKICYLDEKLLNYQNKDNTSQNLLNQISININRLLKSEYSKNEIKKQFNSIEKYIVDFFLFQNRLQDYKLTRSMKLNVSNYNFQLEYFNDMRILFESLKNHKFNNEYFVKCKDLELKNNKLNLSIKDYEKKKLLDDGKIVFLKNNLESKVDQCNKLIEKYDNILDKNKFLFENNNKLIKNYSRIQKHYKFKIKMLFIFICFLIVINTLLFYLFLNNDYYKNQKNEFINGVNILVNNLKLQYNNLINSQFINETMGEYL